MFDVIIVGAGPAGLGLLSSIYRLSSGKRDFKLCMIDKSKSHNTGKLSDYRISSDTRAEKFLTCLDDLPNHILSAPELQSLTLKLKSYGKKAAPLSEVGAFYRVLGQLIQADMISNDQLEFKDETAVLSAKWKEDNWEVLINTHGRSKTLKTKHLALACGASELNENAKAFLQEQDFPLKDANKFTLSSELLKTNKTSPIVKHLKNLDDPQVVIIGGSHSAISSANKLLSLEIKFKDASIKLFHRSPLYVTFESPEEAKKLGFTDFNEEDICPHTNRVYALKGFRLEAARLLKAIRGYNEGGPLEKRVALRRLQETNKSALKDVLRRADLVISSLGYTPNYPPLYDGLSGEKIRLNAPNFVNENSELLDSDSQKVPNCYALGLASNYILAGRFGETSFKGQANGLVLWHKDIGMDIATTLLGH